MKSINYPALRVVVWPLVSLGLTTLKYCRADHMVECASCIETNCHQDVKLDIRRACAVKLSVNDNLKLLIVCVYITCDPQLVNKANVEYEAVLNRVEGLIQSTDCNGIILCGDWNTSFERGNAQTKCLNEFMDRCNVKVAWKHVNVMVRSPFGSEYQLTCK